MNNNSHICKFIAEHPDNWERLLHDEYEIKVRKEGDYAIFNYAIECNFANPVVQEARGIIIDCAALEVVCWPFRKFGNYSEGYADAIDWDSARVLEKVDGSIIKLWYDSKSSKWQFSTNGVIRAENAPVENCVGVTFGSIITRADNYGDIPFDKLDRDNTYIFELVSPETKVVISYATTSLYHIGTRNNKTGVESEVDIGIRKPMSYPIGSLDGCLEAAIELNRCSQTDGEISKEGFVVVDKDWHRVKVKSPDYLVLHRMKQLIISKKDCLAMILDNSRIIAPICDANPNLVPVFKYYEFKLAELQYTADKLANLARSLYLEYSGDRGAVAKIILKHKLSVVALRCLGNDISGRDMLMGFPVEKLAKWIPDYEPEDLNLLFLEGDGKHG